MKNVFREDDKSHEQLNEKIKNKREEQKHRPAGSSCDSPRTCPSNYEPAQFRHCVWDAVCCAHLGPIDTSQRHRPKSKEHRVRPFIPTQSLKWIALGPEAPTNLRSTCKTRPKKSPASAILQMKWKWNIIKKWKREKKNTMLKRKEKCIRNDGCLPARGEGSVTTYKCMKTKRIRWTAATNEMSLLFMNLRHGMDTSA